MANKKQKKQKRREGRQRQEEGRARSLSNQQTAPSAGQVPWQAVPMSLHRMETNLSESLSREERVALIRDIAEGAEREFQQSYFNLGKWFERYDALHLLAYCCTYFLCHPSGVDPEANGGLDFYPHYLEILQAFSLMQERSLSMRPVGPESKELLDLMGSIGPAAIIRSLNAKVNKVDGNSERDFLLLSMRTQTMAVRNPGYPHHIRHVALQLAEAMCQDFNAVHGVDPVQFVECLFHLKEIAMSRLHDHLTRVAKALKETSYRKMGTAYLESFPDVKDFDADGLFDLMGSDLESFKACLMYYSDMRLADCFVFTLDELVSACGQHADRQLVKELIDNLALEFGDLRDFNKEWAVLNNPVWERPFIKLDDETFFLVLVGHIPHYISGLLEALVTHDPALEQKYRIRKAGFLEDEVERLFREAFPHGKLYRGSMWDDGNGDRGENDLTMVLGAVALVVEAKSGSVSPSAKRGAPRRLESTIGDLIVAPSDQANRFIRILEETSGPHIFATRSGSNNTIDVSGVRYFLPLTVTMEQFGFLSNALDLAESGISERKASDLSQVVSLTDLVVIFDVLGLQSEKIHYFLRRRELGSRLRLRGYEMDVLAFYLDSAFNVGEMEFSGNTFVNLVPASINLDPYFVGEQLEVAVEKPQLKLTPRWKSILERLDEELDDRCLDAALVLLNVPYEDQQRLEGEFTRLSHSVLDNRDREPRTWVQLFTAPSERQFRVALYPYLSNYRETGDAIIGDFLDQDDAGQSRGSVCIGVDLDCGGNSYSVVALSEHPDLFDRF